MALTEQERLDFFWNAANAMASVTVPFIAHIAGIEPDFESARLVGSALRLRHLGRRLYVTASHVIDQAEKQFPAYALSAGDSRRPTLLRRAGIDNTVTDIYVAEVPENYPLTAASDYWPSDQIDTGLDVLATDLLFVHGFPGQRSRFTAIFNGLIAESLPYTSMQKIDDLATELAAHQFALYFEPTGAALAETRGDFELPDPSGLSGSAVWRIGVSGRRASEWSPDDALLVGIVTRWDRDKGILIATRASYLIRLLAEWSLKQLGNPQT